MLPPTWCCLGWWSSMYWCLMSTGWSQCCSAQCCPGSSQKYSDTWWWLLCSKQHWRESKEKVSKCKDIWRSFTALYMRLLRLERLTSDLWSHDIWESLHYTFAASQDPSSAFMSAARVSTLVMFHLEMSSSDATRDTEPSSWTTASETPDGNAWENRECGLIHGSV